MNEEKKELLVGIQNTLIDLSRQIGALCSKHEDSAVITDSYSNTCRGRIQRKKKLDRKRYDQVMDILKSKYPQDALIARLITECSGVPLPQLCRIRHIDLNEKKKTINFSNEYGFKEWHITEELFYDLLKHYKAMNVPRNVKVYIFTTRTMEAYNYSSFYYRLRTIAERYNICVDPIELRCIEEK